MAWAGDSSGGGASSSGTTPIWSPLKPASSPDACTDYFDDASLAVKWGTWNPGSNTTVTETATTRAKLLQTTHAGNAVGGIYQAAPAHARYAVTGLVRATGYESNLINGGIFVAGDIVGAPTTAAFISLDMLFGSGSRPMLCSFLNWTKFDTVGGAAILEVAQGMGPLLLRLFVDTVGNTTTMLLSGDDGFTFVKFLSVAHAATDLNADPSYIGMHVNNSNSGVDASLYGQMFRVDATADPYLQCGGWVSALIS